MYSGFHGFRIRDEYPLGSRLAFESSRRGLGGGVTFASSMMGMEMGKGMGMEMEMGDREGGGDGDGDCRMIFTLIITSQRES